MVDIADLRRADQLAAEIQAIDSALTNLDHGGGIVAMVISMDPIPDPPPDGMRWEIGPSQMVPTQHIRHPPAMIASIKQQLQQRQAEIQDKLAQLGVTGEITRR